MPAAYELNQRPPAEVAPAPSRGLPHTRSSAGGRWFQIYAGWSGFRKHHRDMSESCQLKTSWIRIIWGWEKNRYCMLLIIYLDSAFLYRKILFVFCWEATTLKFRSTVGVLGLKLTGHRKRLIDIMPGRSEFIGTSAQTARSQNFLEEIKNAKNMVL